MAASLPALPAELLLKTIECDTTPYEQKLLFATIRIICSELNSKVVHFFRSAHCKNVKVKLTERGIPQLQAIANGPLHSHVRDITINAATFIEQKVVDNEPDTTNASQCSWYLESAMHDMNIMDCKCIFDENVTNFIMDGSLAHMLVPPLSKFANLRSFSIAPPFRFGRMKNQKLDGVKSRWLMACKITLSAVFSGTPTLEHLSVAQGYLHLTLPTAISALEHRSGTQGYRTLPIPIPALEVAIIHRPRWL
jgi:hypothetical protein